MLYHPSLPLHLFLTPFPLLYFKELILYSNGKPLAGSLHDSLLDELNYDLAGLCIPETAVNGL